VSEISGVAQLYAGAQFYALLNVTPEVDDDMGLRLGAQLVLMREVLSGLYIADA
jgi:hypothetical protein